MVSLIELPRLPKKHPQHSISITCEIQSFLKHLLLYLLQDLALLHSVLWIFLSASHVVMFSNFSCHVPSFIHILVTELNLRPESSLWPAHSCSSHHSGSPHRSHSLAFLSFRVASVNSEPRVHFETTAATISKLSISGLCAADWPQWKKEHQIWQKVVTEFRYQEQKGKGGNGSMVEDCIKLIYSDFL